MKKSIIKTITSNLFEGNILRKRVAPMQASFVLALLLCMLMPQEANAGDWNGMTVTFDFTKYNGGQNFDQGSYYKTIKYNNSSQALNFFDAYGALEGYFAASGSFGDPSDHKRWFVNDYNGNKGLYHNHNGARYLSVVKLYQGDQITFNYTGGSVTYIGNGQLQNRSTGDILSSGTTYTIAADGCVDLLVSKGDCYISKVVIQYNSSRVIWGGAQAGTKEIDGITYPLYRYRLSSRSFEEPTLTVIPGGKTINSYTVQNVGESVGQPTVAIYNQDKWNNNREFDLMFINQGLCKVTANLSDGSTASYLVEAWDNEAYYTITDLENGKGKKFSFAKDPSISSDSEQGGVLKTRIVTAVPGLETGFSVTESGVESNTTVTYLNDGHMVSFNNNNEGWWDRHPYNDNDTPDGGTFYYFRATAKGKLKFGGIKTQTGGTVYIVNMSNVTDHRDVFSSDQSGYLESGELEMNPGQLYFMHGQANSGDNKWAPFLLEWFSYETGIQISEPYGVSALTGYELGSSSITSRATVTDSYGGTLSVLDKKYKGTITSADVSVVDGHIVFSNVTFSTSEEDKMGGAIKVKIGEGSSYKEFVMTIPYGKHVWDFRNTTTPDAYPGTGGTDGVTYTAEGLVNDMKANTDDWSRVYKVHRRLNGAWTELATPLLAARGSVAGNNAFYMSNTAGLIVEAGAESFGAHENESMNSTTGYDELTADQRYYLDESTVQGADQVWIHNVGAKILFPGVKPGQYIKVYCRRHAPGKGTLYTAKNLWDLKDTNITGLLDVTGMQQDNRRLRGVLIFKVPTTYVPTDDISKIPALVLMDDGWTRFAQVEITDVYSTDQVTYKDSWKIDEVDAMDEPREVHAVNSNANVVYKTNATIQVNDYVNTYTQAAWWPEITILNPDGITYDEPTYSYDDKLDDEGNVIGQTNMKHLNINITGGQGNLCIIQDMVTGGYTLDRIETWIPVSQYHPQTYPYTWDFTAHNMSDPWAEGGKKSAAADATTPYARMASTSANSAPNKYGRWENGKLVTFVGEDYHVNIYDQYKASDETHKKAQVIRPLFADGGELTYGNVPLNETKGLLIGLPRIGQDDAATVADIEAGGKYADYNGTLELLSTGGLKITAPKAVAGLSRNHITTSISIPEVDENMYIFVKANAEPTVANVTKVTDKYDVADGVYLYKKDTSKDNKAIFQFTNATIYKIGVTNIEKSINELGYATESRAFPIDHTYTGEFTNNDVNAYAITTYTAEGDVYDYKGYPQVRKSENEVTVVPANTGVVLYKSGNSARFSAPLFYPAVNVTSSAQDELTLADNWMAPNVESKRHYSEVIQKNAAMGGTDDTWCTKFIMTRKYYTYNKTSGTFSEEQTSEVEAFYRMILDTNESTAAQHNTIGANKAYLLIPSDKLPVALWNGGTGLAKDIIYMDLEDVENADADDNGGTTAIDNAIVEEAESDMEQKVYYTIDGFRINGKPTKKGVYICNGKKVYIK